MGWGKSQFVGVLLCLRSSLALASPLDNRPAVATGAGADNSAATVSPRPQSHFAKTMKRVLTS